MLVTPRWPCVDSTRAYAVAPLAPTTGSTSETRLVTWPLMLELPTDWDMGMGDTWTCERMEDG